MCQTCGAICSNTKTTVGYIEIANMLNTRIKDEFTSSDRQIKFQDHDIYQSEEISPKPLLRNRPKINQIQPISIKYADPKLQSNERKSDNDNAKNWNFELVIFYILTNFLEVENRSLNGNSENGTKSKAEENLLASPDLSKSRLSVLIISINLKIKYLFIFYGLFSESHFFIKIFINYIRVEPK